MEIVTLAEGTEVPDLKNGATEVTEVTKKTMEVFFQST
jgi:hypothetical protein